MKTLVMLELMPGDDYDATLRCLVLDRLKRESPEERCAVASCTPGTVQERFLGMALEVDQRAQETIENHAAVSEGYVKCMYVALRSLHFIKPAHDTYELGILLMVFKTRGQVLRRFVVPDLDESTPGHALEMLGEELGAAQASLRTAIATPYEEKVTGKQADSVIGAFADLATSFRSKLC